MNEETFYKVFHLNLNYEEFLIAADDEKKRKKTHFYCSMVGESDTSRAILIPLSQAHTRALYTEPKKTFCRQ